MAIFTQGDDANDLNLILGILNSHFTLHFLKMLTSADAYQVGYVRKLPCNIDDSSAAANTIRNASLVAIKARQSLDLLDERCRLFQVPIVIAAHTENFQEAAQWAGNLRLGVGGNAEPSCLRAPLTALGADSEFDISTPWTFAVFKTKGGGRAYFHGGLSPQELVVPIVTMFSKMKSPSPKEGIAWTLTPGTPKLTTRFFSVQIAGSQSESNLFGFEPPKVRVELRANKKCVSTPVSASYGFENATGDVSLRISDNNKQIEPNTVTVFIPEEINQKTVGLYLLDAATGAELTTPLTVEVAISV